jgi:hypothetical protein
MPQVPLEHVAAALGRAGHEAPHAPQLVLLVEVFTSHPSASLALQLAKPGLHVLMRHAPLTHAGVAFGSAHVRPHIPQLVVSLAVAVSQPSVSLPLQLAKPVLHDPMRQVPCVHAGVAFVRAQRTPHAPQWARVVRRSTSHPSARVLLQSP